MRFGVFCSGGDSPGMNACVRAVVRSAVSLGHEVVGIRRGYQGLLDEDFFLNENHQPRMHLRSVSDIVHRGGTILHSARCPEFRQVAGQQKGAEVLRKHGIEGLVAIGGDGTLRGAIDLQKFWDGRVIGCPGTIDNDLFGTDYTIGFKTAVSTAVELVDKIRDTAESHERMFLVEVMGRHSGYIALHTALATGAEIVCLPETVTDIHALLKQIHLMRARGKSSILCIVAEGDELGNAFQIQQKLEAAQCPISSRVVVLGHTQRGGSPVPDDRILASLLGDFAVRSILAGKTGYLAGRINRHLTLTPFAEATAAHRQVPEELMKLLEDLTR